VMTRGMQTSWLASPTRSMASSISPTTKQRRGSTPFRGAGGALDIPSVSCDHVCTCASFHACMLMFLRVYMQARLHNLQVACAIVRLHVLAHAYSEHVEEIRAGSLPDEFLDIHSKD